MGRKSNLQLTESYFEMRMKSIIRFMFHVSDQTKLYDV